MDRYGAVRAMCNDGRGDGLALRNGTLSCLVCGEGMRPVTIMIVELLEERGTHLDGVFSDVRIRRARGARHARKDPTPCGGHNLHETHATTWTIFCVIDVGIPFA